MHADARHKVFIDTDIGNDIDDAFALAFALLHPQLDVVGVSTVDHYGAVRARIVQALFDVTGKSDLDVSIGCQASPTHASLPPFPEQLSWAVQSLLPSEREALGDAQQHLYDVASKYPGEVTVVGLGRLTNVDQALRRFPDLGKKLKGLSIMGGEVDVFRREHNFANDYMAADRVLLSGLPTFLATWSVSGQLTLSADELVQLWSCGTRLTDLLSGLQLVWGHQPILYDLSPLLWLIRPDLFQTRSMHLRVETTGLWTRGVVVEVDPSGYGLPIAECTVAGYPPPVAHPIETTRALDVEGAKKILLQTLGVGRKAVDGAHSGHQRDGSLPSTSGSGR